MAMQKRIPFAHHAVFPHSAFLVGEVVAVVDFNAPARADGSKPQQTDRDSGLPVWSVQVLDADPEAGKKDKTVTVKIVAAHQPVPPVNETPFPFTPVEFVGLTALPYVEETGNGRARIAWSYRAEGMVAPGQSNKVQAPRKSEAA
ncbi:plasmid replication, integration and excision activator [Arsenicicoccus dermatophilus]|uniref:plasmid replication, integration and excision activator n=1 Tax=Arsenicicoccus dermatophilus TaxID=1076331 RepID=UPI001F4D170D|nr:plasmid replication, integration and excision activator [Arsenicicoccus dermatophilus]MCH8611898.1 plasmid replication, integration and excision activator [Arsenicicoccus dermatophilus]